MYDGSLSHDDIIRAFTRHVPGSYVRDYRANGGYITICKYTRDIPWRDQLSTRKVERQVPAVTLVSLPRGYVRPRSTFYGLRLDRPGWHDQFRKATRFLTEAQMRRITKELHVGEVFPGIR